MNDQELNLWLDRLIDGDESAFDVIYKLTKTKIYGTVAALMVRNKEDVNDIVTEVYYQLWKALPNYDRKRPFLFWLNGLVIKQVNNWRRQIWRRFRLLEKMNRLDHGTLAQMPDESLMERDSRSEMQIRINRLPFKLRAVIVYRYYYEYSYEQIAELLQIPLGTVKSRHHLAIKQIRQEFHEKMTEGVFKGVYLDKN